MKEISRMLAWTAICAVFLAATAPAAAAADAYANFPEKPVRFIVPFPPGALNDFLGRVLAAKLSETWKRSTVVDNRAGGNTIIGTDMAAKAPPDGYTLFLCSFATAVNQSLYAKLPYDPNKDFAFVTLVASSPYILVVQASLPAKSLAELVTLARAKPGQINYGSTGNGGTSNLMGEMLKSMAKIDLVHVPYKGLAPVISDMLGGQINMSFGSYSTVSPHLKSARLRGLAVTSVKRSAYTPDMPSIAESGYPGYEADPWWGITVPAGTARALIARLNRDIVRVLQAPDVMDKLQGAGIEIVTSTPERFAAYFASEVVRWGKVVREAGVKAD
jgi:tripartite-type tricarboxylate transporter receptor subunit TctC